MSHRTAPFGIARIVRPGDAACMVGADDGLVVVEDEDAVVVLPPAAAVTSDFLAIKKLAPNGTLTIQAQPGETVDGHERGVFKKQYRAVLLASDGARWHIVASHNA